MTIAIPKESEPGETRAAATPDSVARFTRMGAVVLVESGLGSASGYQDSAYENAGARILQDRRELVGQAAVLLRVRKPPAEEISWMREGALHISFLDPFNEKELVQKLADSGISTISMEMIPRISRAQKMDALTSQANLAGYAAVIQGAALMKQILPMMSTAAGTILPARVFVIGAGVAGLQAIATARRLGAKVDAFDTRPVVAEQVRSLGARFAEIDVGGETGETKQGYARELTPQQLQRQRDGMKELCSEADLVITTAQVFGRRAPVIVTRDMIESMKPGSVVVDMAVASGGNVEGSVGGQTIDIGGVRILGHLNLAGCVPRHSSQVYAANLVALLEDCWKKKETTLAIDPDDEILKQCLVTHAGAICHPSLKE